MAHKGPYRLKKQYAIKGVNNVGYKYRTIKRSNKQQDG